MVLSERLFISHAASDKPLAGLFERLLLVTGIPRHRIFYSSDRATGVPAGRGSREVLKEMLKDHPFVLELITESFMTRPMCLMELGAAWVTDVPTFPIVVPPLTRNEVILQIGDVHLPMLGSQGDLDELFDELHDRANQHLGLSIQSSAWNPAVRQFKEALPSILTALGASRSTHAPGSGASNSAIPGTTAPQGERLTPQLIASNTTRVDSVRSTDVLGELTNDATVDLQMVLLSATFYDAAGAILGTANGSLNDLPAGSTKTFRLSSTSKIVGIESMRLQTDGQI